LELTAGDEPTRRPWRKRLFIVDFSAGSADIRKCPV